MRISSRVVWGALLAALGLIFLWGIPLRERAIGFGGLSADQERVAASQSGAGEAPSHGADTVSRSDDAKTQSPASLRGGKGGKGDGQKHGSKQSGVQSGDDSGYDQPGAPGTSRPSSSTRGTSSSQETSSSSSSSQETSSSKPGGVQASPAKEATVRENERLRAWVEENRNKQLLLVQADNRELARDGKMSDSYVHSSIVSFRVFARKYNYTSIWVTGSAPAPHGLAMAGYWNKVPAAMMGLKLARLAGIPYVLMADSDSVPSEVFTVDRSPCDLGKILRESGMHVGLSKDVEFWSRLVAGMKVYDTAINSGGILFDTSPEAEELLRHWWLVATKQVTPYERLRSTLRVTTVYKDDSVASRVARMRIDEELKRALGLAVMVKASKVVGREWMLEFALHPRQAFRSKSDFDEIETACCGPERRCSHIALANTTLSDSSIESVTCKATPHDTLTAWPGEQDRLNWLISDAFRNSSRPVEGVMRCDGASAKHTREICFQHLCNSKDHLIGEPVFRYMASAESKTPYPHLVNLRREAWDGVEGRKILGEVARIASTASVFDSESESFFKFD